MATTVTQASMIDHVWREGLRRRDKQLQQLRFYVDRVDVDVFLRLMFESLANALWKPGDSFMWPGFGTWKVVERPAREGRHPRTHARIWLTERVTVVFRPNELWRELLQESRERRRKPTPDPLAVHRSGPCPHPTAAGLRGCAPGWRGG